MVDALTTSWFQAADLGVETKPDLTPVSDADKAAEDLVRTQLRRTRPRDAVVGEEFAPTGHSSRQWVVDPIDGTKNFVRGVPVWATLLALLDDGEPVVGLVSAPALGRRWWAARGTGAWADHEPIRVSAVTDLGDAQLSYDSMVEFEESGWGDAARDLERRCWRARGLGDFWSHVLVAEG